MAVLVGLQASGKTTFCREALGPGYVQVSKDHFPNARNRQRRQLRLVREAWPAHSDDREGPPLWPAALATKVAARYHAGPSGLYVATRIA